MRPPRFLWLRPHHLLGTDRLLQHQTRYQKGTQRYFLLLLPAPLASSALGLVWAWLVALSVHKQLTLIVSITHQTPTHQNPSPPHLCNDAKHTQYLNQQKRKRARSSIGSIQTDTNRTKPATMTRGIATPRGKQ